MEKRLGKKFNNELDKLSRKFKDIREDINNLGERLTINPLLGSFFKHKSYKIRMSSGGIGKSGGFRVLYYYSKEESFIMFLTIYHKSQKDIITEEELEKILTEEGLL